MPAYLLIPAISVAIVVVQMVALLAMGHPAICTCGYVSLWHGDVASAGNSQHLTDWYTFSHIIHGMIFYGVLALVTPRLSVWQKLAIAIAIEAGWEIVENTPFLMERYREQALAQGYYGDSAINSLFDTLAMIVGFGFARLVPPWPTVALAVSLELFTAYAIRDNLTLNVIQLIAPSEAISRWQSET
jgi:hypothetical protein